MNEDLSAPRSSPGTPQFEARKGATDWPQILAEVGFDAMSRRDRKAFLDTWGWLVQHKADWTSQYDGLMTWAATAKLAQAADKQEQDREDREKRRINRRNLSLLSIAVVFACGVMGAGSAIIANTIEHNQITVVVKSQSGQAIPTLTPLPTETPG